jgi:hypothetical protein
MARHRTGDTTRHDATTHNTHMHTQQQRQQNSTAAQHRGWSNNAHAMNNSTPAAQHNGTAQQPMNAPT